MYTNLVFFNSVTSSRMTPSGNIVWSSIFDPTTFLYISLRLQIPCTCGLPTSYLSNTSNRRHLWNPIKYLWWNFFAEIVNILRPLAVSRCWRAPSWMFNRILNVTLPNNLLQLEEGLRRSFPPLWSSKGILDFPCLLILFIYTKYQDKILDWPHVLISFGNTRNENIKKNSSTK